MRTTSKHFRAQVTEALGNETLQASLEGVRRVMPKIRAAAVDQCDDFAGLCAQAEEVRQHSIDHLDQLLETFEQQVVAAGGLVHWARTGEEATQIIADLCASVNCRSIIKSKSMVSEEIELNIALESAGYEVTETDLGEYIIQLRGEKPSHILAPSLHVSLAEVGETFDAKHGIERDVPPTDADEMLLEARGVLREKFLSADVGITGANFLVAETGGVVVVTNEGNADLGMSLPDTHIVVTGIEKVIRSLADAGVLLRVLARSAIGERLSNYTTFIHGARQDGEISGPREFHVVLVDNGRSQLLGSGFRDMLRCIRCSACLNHCPVYTAVGGHAYGSVYSGPMGAILTPAFAGLPGTVHLPNASTLCGCCESICPVGIPLVKLLRHWREVSHTQSLPTAGERFMLGCWRLANRWPFIYRLVTTLGVTLVRSLSVAGDGRQRWLKRLPFFAAAWTQHRDIPAPVSNSFQNQWRQAKGGRKP
ncbi:MAG: LutB/LldF family L-lactate oxidation iron-sulfur protein [Gammaproteobacteria bacterium]|jgi:L-lactate dehydrogenase complex protein LldF|nr:LutB/LldF family L-lactate oxidation iron-sulfur protein [Gammaproteobacteria bacterium]